jgi:hypothetical protein
MCKLFGIIFIVNLVVFSISAQTFEGVFLKSNGHLKDFPNREFVNRMYDQDDRLANANDRGYDDSTSVKTTATYNKPDDFFRGDGQTRRCHSEVSSKAVAGEGDVVWAVTAIQFSGDNNSARILHQWKDTVEWATSSFIVADPIVGTNEMSIRLAVFTPPSTKEDITGKRVDLPNINAISTVKVNTGKWYTIATKQKFSTSDDGYIDFYFNGKLVPPAVGFGRDGHTYSGPTISHAHKGKFLRYQVGNYAFFGKNANPHASDKEISPTSKSINYIDNVLVAAGSLSPNLVLIPKNKNQAENSPIIK